MIRKCAQCGQFNRVPVGHLADVGRCGACKAPLPPLDTPLAVNQVQFDEIVAGARVPVLVDFWAPWCGPCRAVEPEIQALAREMAGRALVLEVNADEQPQLAQRFGVRGIPYFAVLKNGKIVSQQVGVVDRRRLRAWLDEANTSVSPGPPSM